MKIEKITENKIRIVINLDELSDQKVDFNDIVENNLNSQKFLLDVLNRAEKEVGFKTKNCKLLIETFSSLDEIFVFTITKFTSVNKNNTNLKKKYNNRRPILKNPIYQFSSFEEFCNLCEALNKSHVPITNIAKKISLYLFDDTYYLVFSNLNLSYKYFKKLFSILSEFATAIRMSSSFESKLIEYGKPIIKQNAFKTGFNYFV